MILFNTSFHLTNDIDSEFKIWITGTYAPTAQRAGIFSDFTFTRILTTDDQNTVGYCFQMKCENMESAARWDERDGVGLRRELSMRWNDKIVFFSTYMEILDI